MKDNQYDPKIGFYDDYMGVHPDAIRTVEVPASECKIVENHVSTLNYEVKAAKHICACGAEDRFRIFSKGYATIAQCSVCSNEKVIYES